MMKKLLFLCVPVLLCSCDKSEDISGPDSADVALFGQQSWRITAIFSDKPMDINGDGVALTDIYAQRESCLKDDFYKGRGQNDPAVIVAVVENEDACTFDNALKLLTMEKVSEDIYQVTLPGGMERRVYGFGETSMDNWKLVSATKQQIEFLSTKVIAGNVYNITLVFEAI